MDQELIMKKIVEEVMKAMGQGMNSATDITAPIFKVSETNIDIESYPFGEKIPDSIYSRSGKKLSDMTLENVINGSLTADDMRISPETMEMQAQVAESAGRKTVAGNLRRAAELISVPDDRLLEIYNALRPYRSSKQELLDIADELENKYNCIVCSAFVRDAANVYEKRDKLRQD